MNQVYCNVYTNHTKNYVFFERTTHISDNKNKLLTSLQTRIQIFFQYLVHIDIIQKLYSKNKEEVQGNRSRDYCISARNFHLLTKLFSCIVYKANIVLANEAY